jgi:hypothetical protein
MLPRRSLPISLNLMGTRAILVDSHRVKMTLTETGSGKVAVQDEWPLQSSDQQQVVLDISKLQPGKYRWQISLMNANSGEIAVGKPDASGELEALEGPFFE